MSLWSSFSALYTHICSIENIQVEIKYIRTQTDTLQFQNRSLAHQNSEHTVRRCICGRKNEEEEKKEVKTKIKERKKNYFYFYKT